jgi:uracil phosphoribosyltransferase
LDYKKQILDTFPIDTKSVTQRPFKSINKDSRLFKIDPEKSSLIDSSDVQIYLIDTSAGREIACHPHIVSNQLSDLCLKAAEEFVNLLYELHLISEYSGILHILRGSLGYMTHMVLQKLPIINIRTQYIYNSFRNHLDDFKKIKVTFSDFDNSNFDSLIIPDTYATGKSAEAALNYLFEKKIEVEHIIMYGFIAIPAIVRINKLLQNFECDLYVFAICDIPQLCSNYYDMPLYGLDEYLYKQQRITRKLGSIVSEETLSKMLPWYIPGMDQPGDWSERHDWLFNGYKNENGNIIGHLLRSIEFIESLNSLNSTQKWYNEKINKLTMKEIKNCKKNLKFQQKLSLN